MKPFKVVAHLEQGAVLDTRFGMGLDALLASVIRQRQKDQLGISGSELDGGTHVNNVHIVPLPLARCTAGPTWHWNATCARPGDQQDPDVHTIVQKIDHDALEHWVGSRLPKDVSTTSGRWRERIVPIVTTPTRTLTWSAVGNVNAVRDLLDDIVSIGQRRGIGEGRVVRWEVLEQVGSVDVYGHMDEGELARPVFAQCFDRLPISMNDYPIVSAGIRPPYWHLGNQHDVYVPTRK